MTESVLSLAMLASRFRLDLEEEEVVEPVCRLTLRPGESLPMRLTRRVRTDPVPPSC